MAIDEYDAVHSTEGKECEDFVREGSDLHWSLGSPLTWITAEMLQQELKDKNLATNLRQFLNNFVVDVTLQSNDVINTSPWRTWSNYYAAAYPINQLDIAVVRMLKLSKWVPKTKWAGVRVYDEKKSLDFVMIKYLIRGAIPVFDTKKLSMTYLNDLIEGDMFYVQGTNNNICCLLMQSSMSLSSIKQ
ncbi:hypothetical protein B0H14DRAFT_3639138 [Mycena olivaceomarginata]|nr:hypothetical protein B0H14DRAFT_3639138 [Mycena olivaceomarginata]